MNVEFCTTCRKNTKYVLKKEKYNKVIRDKEYEFDITIAECAECGNRIGIPELIDQNVREVDEQYRKAEEIVTNEDIEKMMKVYRIGKTPLSLTLGFGEITITRYLSGQVPSKEYSDILRSVMTSPSLMKKKLKQNKDKIAGAAYNKAYKAAEEVDYMFKISKEMQCVIAYVFNNLEEVTPLTLQKMLYYSQGLSYVLRGEQLFPEDCQAWIHGPVYPEVYNLFKDFKYNPIEDDRFALFSGYEKYLSSSEKEVINLTTNTFGLYGGKTLERITHIETPWLEARGGFDDSIPSNAEISKDSIRDYFEQVDTQYSIRSEEGLNAYISSVIRA